MKEFNYDAGERFRKRHAFDKVNRRIPRGPGPNSLERKLSKILGPSFTYTGNGTYRIDNLKPDFVSESRRLVIELYGNYWHRNETIQKTMQRVSRYNRKGWRVIIIWEDEVHDPVKLNRKLALI